ncbi:NXPE family member 4-like isoform X2 [Rhinatrema bivittatum]|uniref:NXPE family member 4-like isoform X2 n=1 Tax=Rhinatrema bivittatum TaxID=194408 RepID=UPI00112E2A37|nr:NXPE family member 4-like isoform X2 [Rhinatrema bivittatum]XP_029429388.1 NXPE family member 4-like isoform X2 [Rhinatrema bivittatum]
MWISARCNAHGSQNLRKVTSSVPASDSGRHTKRNTMFLLGTMRYTTLVALVATVITLLSFMYHRNLVKLPTFRFFHENCTDHLNNSELSTAKMNPTKMELKIKEILNKIDQLIPKVTYTHMDNTTSAKKSRATLLNPKDRYCIGDPLTIQLDMYDYLGIRKKYGGDFITARIYSPELKAGASGRIEDLNNGSYLVHFTLLWEGRVQFSLLLNHPSEAVSALWKAKNGGYKHVYHTGKFTNGTHEEQTECGFQVETSKELCGYLEQRDEEFFYCVKPTHLSCGALTELMRQFTQNTYLSELEKSLLVRSNVRLEITQTFTTVDVIHCNKNDTFVKEKCRTGFKVHFPGGHFLQNVWNPLFCTMSSYKTMDDINSCLKGKQLYLIGDSTMLQWMTYLMDTVKTLKYFNLYGSGWAMTRLALDMDRNIKIQWKKHGNPFVVKGFLTFKEDAYITQQIDAIAGNKYTAIAFTMGMHFRPFPLHIFIRRVINIRKAVERLLHRSPDTKVVIKTENTSVMKKDYEMLSDFHGYIQYSVLNYIFQDLNVGVVDAWDMTVAYASNDIHPSREVIENEVNMFLTYIC